jgi:polyisoprenoid-binding protein YceI
MRKLLFVPIALFLIQQLQAQVFQPVDEKSDIKFIIKNFGIKTGGSFKGLKGTIVMDAANPSGISFDVTIDAKTVNTDNDSRDNHLRKDEYFNVGAFPVISFKSEKITGNNLNKLFVYGKLSIKGVSKNITIPFKATAKEDGYLFEGTFSINRRDYNVGSGSMVLGDNVELILSVFARKK